MGRRDLVAGLLRGDPTTPWPVRVPSACVPVCCTQRWVVLFCLSAWCGRACGHFTYGPQYEDEVLQKVHREVEACDSPQSFFTIHSLGGGTGVCARCFVVVAVAVAVVARARARVCVCFCFSLRPSSGEFTRSASVSWKWRVEQALAWERMWCGSWPTSFLTSTASTLVRQPCATTHEPGW